MNCLLCTIALLKFLDDAPTSPLKFCLNWNKTCSPQVQFLTGWSTRFSLKIVQKYFESIKATIFTCFIQDFIAYIAQHIYVKLLILTIPEKHRIYLLFYFIVMKNAIGWIDRI